MINRAMSTEQMENISKKHLSAKELLRNKGITSKAWNEWDATSQALPKLGSKQFQPNGSWLQNKQIEKGLESRKFLLGIERVERSSQLASAEWLPEQKKARVTKKSGQDWNNFGSEVNSNLYLIAEEALILLETECLELLWEGVPLSIEQAYQVLIDSDGSNCSLEEYRVYSQLTRLGYRLQRFFYNKSQLERVGRWDDSVQRKKVIVDPENGLWMTRKNVDNVQSSKIEKKPDVDNDIKEIVENMVTSINGVEAIINNSSHCTVKSDEIKDDTVPERKGKNSKVEIISEQTILSPIKIVKDSDLPVSKWPGSRIQRNVKLLPKRNDKIPITIGNADISSGDRASDKRKRGQSRDSPESKKSKHEVIELSDDEIEEIPRPMSRMEMLNCLPNIANQIFITENIPRRYIPQGVRPRRSYRYDSRSLRRMHDIDKTLKTNFEGHRSNETRNSTQMNSCENESTSRALIPYQNYPRFNRPPRHNHPNNYYSRNLNGPYFPNANNFSSMMMNMSTGIYMQQMGVAPGGWQNAHGMIPANRWASYQMNMFRNVALMGYAMRSISMQNAYNSNFHHNMSFAMFQQQNNRPHRYLERPRRGSHTAIAFPRSRGSMRDEQSTSSSYSAEKSIQKSKDEIYQAAFTTLPGTSSWSELKQKWRDAKTITVDDEDCSNYDDDGSGDVQVVDQTLQPLNGPKNSPRSITEIYERLRIIKSAPDRTVRRKKGDFKISYNVYSTTQNFRKSNPGTPIFHLVVTSRKESDFLQPIELNRLQQDGKGSQIMFAHVSNSSIAYIQPGLVTLPNLL